MRRTREGGQGVFRIVKTRRLRELAEAAGVERDRYERLEAERERLESALQVERDSVDRLEEALEDAREAEWQATAERYADRCAELETDREPLRQRVKELEAELEGAGKAMHELATTHPSVWALLAAKLLPRYMDELEAARGRVAELEQDLNARATPAMNGDSI